MIKIVKYPKKYSITYSFNKNNPRQLVRDTNSELIRSIVTRTLQGKDVNNKQFTPYKSSTIKQKSKQGKSTNVNLKDTFKMLRSIVSRVSNTKAIITLTSAYASYIQNGTTHMPKRKFFGFSTDDKKKTVTRFKRHIKFKGKKI